MCIYSRGIARFIDQRTTFTRPQSVILQSRDLNLRVERARKFLTREANISKTNLAAKAECKCKIVKKKKSAEWNFSSLEISIFFLI